MKIAFRHVPFTADQMHELDAMAAAAGCETLWCSPDVPDLDTIRDCEVLMGYFPPALFKDMPALKWVQTPAAGVEKLCSAEYANDSVMVTNCSGAFGVAIAEYMLTGLLMLMRRMPSYGANQRAHLWQRTGQCRSIYGSTITVVGMGDIGTKFARRAKALGATVRGVRRTMTPAPEGFDQVFTSENICEAVKDVDAVVMCVPGTQAASHLVSAEVIACMDKRTILVNCGRGATLDEPALIAALQDGRLAGAVLDVCAVEPLPDESPLWDMENVVLTPHISGHDDDPVNAASIFAIFKENLAHFLAGEPLTHVVDRTRGY